MNRGLDLFAYASRGASALSGGQSPTRWRHRESRRVESLAALQRAGGWLQHVIAVLPRLCEAPWWGPCLTSLCARGAAPPEPARKPLPPRPASFDRPEDATARGRKQAWTQTTRADLVRRSLGPPSSRRAAPRAAPPWRRPTEALTHSRPQADQALLSRLSGEPSFGVDGEVRNPYVIERGRRSGGGPGPAIPPAATTQREWLEALAQRAGRAWRQNSPEGAGGPRLGSAPDRGRSAMPSLAAEWSRTLDGQMVSGEFLAECARLPRSGDVHAPRSAGPAAGPAASGDQSPSASAVAPRWGDARQAGASRAWANGVTDHEAVAVNADEGLDGETVASPVWRHPSARPALEPTTDPWPAVGHEPLVIPPASTRSARSTGADDGEWPEPGLATLSDLAPSLLPLVPPPGPGAAVSAVAAATVRRGARIEEVSAREDDLGALAARIKRILDEEARRHGIDV
jgi:hypothetical protein